MLQLAKSVVSCPLNKLFGSTQDPTNHNTESVNLSLLNIKVLDLRSDRTVSWKEHYQFDIIYLKDLLKTSINNIDVGISNIHQPNHTVQFEVKNFGEEFWEVPCLPHYVTLAVHRSE